MTESALQIGARGGLVRENGGGCGVSLLANVDMLKRAAAILAAVQGDDGVADFGKRLDRWIASGTGTLDALSGIEPQQGGRSWRTELAQADRDELLRRASKLYSMNAAELADALQRYQETAWQRERNDTHCPARHTDTVEALLWEILRLKPIAIGEKQMKAILGSEFGDLTSESLWNEKLASKV